MKFVLTDAYIAQFFELEAIDHFTAFLKSNKFPVTQDTINLCGQVYIDTFKPIKYSDILYIGNLIRDLLPIFKEKYYKIKLASIL